jgi:hypothetical protein
VQAALAGMAGREFQGMAKRKTADPTTPTPAALRRRRATADPAPPPVDIAAVAGTEAIETAADHSGRRDTGGASHNPTAEEIAEAAYHRYLSRGGQDGADFDDWVEAERDLRSRSHPTSQ